MGETLKEITKGGADVVIDCVGMDGKKSPLEYIEQKLRSYMQTLYDQIVKGEIDPTTIITHILPLDKAAHGYDVFNKKQDDCIKVILNLNIFINKITRL